MSLLLTPGPAKAQGLLDRAHELEQLADLVSYGPDKARLKERASWLRREAVQVSAEDET